MRTFGLIGKSLEHSFSSQYFNEKFFKEGITDTQYLNFELKHISEFTELIKTHKLSGLNVTIPYKESIIPFLDELNEEAKEIGAVNTIQFSNGKTIGHNTDHIGFTNSIQPLLEGRNKAIILGDGGAAKAIKYALKKLNIEYKTINRNTSFDYLDITKQITGYYTIIINTTPVGSYPNINDFPKIPYEYLNQNYLLFDLIYNPNETKFLAYGKAKNAQTKNGLEMLQLQAEESWNIWNI
ncbi:MAG: shikimate dehydrogenase [Pelagibacterales bacterium]|nr:shikimate dehydrogenase [Pelagibacterales bacterium]